MGDQYISVTDRHNGSQIHLGSGLYSIVTVYNCHCEVLMLFPCYLQLIISTLWWVLCGWQFGVLTFAAWVRQIVVVVVVLVLSYCRFLFMTLAACGLPRPLRGGTINGRLSSHEILAHSAPTVNDESASPRVGEGPHCRGAVPAAIISWFLSLNYMSVWAQS